MINYHYVIVNWYMTGLKEQNVVDHTEYFSAEFYK